METLIESLDTVFYTAIFLLPGFLIVNIIDSTNPPRKQSEFAYILKYLSYSLISCALCTPLYSVIFNIKCKFLYWLLFVGATILIAFVVGVTFSYIKHNEVINKLLRIFKISLFPSTPTAWDYMFAKQERHYMIVTLNNDEKIRGWYSSKSFASSDPDIHDLFIEKAFVLGKDGMWNEDKENAGLYIPNGQIKLIEIKERRE